MVALKCPSCGNACNVESKSTTFGMQVKCKYCQTESVLIINRELYSAKPHEHVCTKCGRVAREGARFCQCRAALLKKCVLCSAEIPVDYKVCDKCGATPGPEQIPDDFFDDELRGS